MSYHVLVVDDERSILIPLEYLLKREGFTVSVADDGEAGLAAIRTHRPDLVVLDVMMPKLDGFAVLQAVRADPELAATRIMILTAMDREAERNKGLLLGVDAYMAKPFSTKALISNVYRLLGLDMTARTSGD